MTLNEVSEQIGYSPSTVIHHFMRTQKKLKEKGILLMKEKINNVNNYSITKIEPEPKEERFKIGEYYGPNKNIKLLKKLNEHKQGTKQYLYEFECPYCNKIFINTISKINNGNTKSCGCLKKPNHVGEHYDNYDVIEELTTRRTGHVLYKCKCKCGNYFEVPSNLLGKTASCGCLQSKGEALLEKIFQKNNISYEREKRFSDCVYNNNHLRFDFFLIDYNILIEYDGTLHFFCQETSKSWNNKEKLIETQKRDEYKNNWCKEHNIPLIRIPYFDKEKISLKYIEQRIQEVIK